jgi:hypothetical protein
MHFRDPASLCQATKGGEGDVGDRLWARVSEEGNNASHFYPLPLTRDAINPSDGWVAGGCLPSDVLSGNGMGQHYWRHFHPRMALADGYPWFTLYDQNDELTMFGLAVGGPLYAFPTGSGEQDHTWQKDPQKISGPNKFFYPHASSSELWTYPGQPLIPFFHLHSYMPEVGGCGEALSVVRSPHSFIVILLCPMPTPTPHRNCCFST